MEAGIESVQRDVGTIALNLEKSVVTAQPLATNIALLGRDVEELRKWRETIEARAWQIKTLLIGSTITAIISLLFALWRH